MRSNSMTAAGLAAFLCCAPAQAAAFDGSAAERPVDLEQRIRHPERRLADQDRPLTEKNRQPAKRAASQKKDSAAGRTDLVALTGLLEVDAIYHEPAAIEGGNPSSTTDLVLATVELGVTAQLRDWVGGELRFLFEEDMNGDDLDVDVATLMLAPPDGRWAVAAGWMYLPFGVFETRMISDPLTLQLGELRETALRFDIAGENLRGSVFAYDDENAQDGGDRLDNFGVALGYATENDDGAGFGLRLAYVTDLGEANVLQDQINDNLGEGGYAERTAGLAASARGRFGDIAVMAEYVTAAGRFDPAVLSYGAAFVGHEAARGTAPASPARYAPRGARPSSWMLEAGRDFALAKRPANVAVGVQGADAALGLGWPKTRFMLGGSIKLTNQLGLAVEWAHDENYDDGDGRSCAVTGESAMAKTEADLSPDDLECAGGAGGNADTITVRLFARF